MRIALSRGAALDKARALRPPLWPRLALSAGLLLITAALATAYGAAHIPATTVFRILLSHVPGVSLEQDWPASWEAIVWEVRLPRVIMAGLAGGALAFSGSTYQGIFRNSIADPYLIGVAAGAGLGAAAAIAAGVPYAYGGFSVLPLIAFGGGLFAVGLSYGLARTGPSTPAASFVLAGVAVSSMGTSVTALIMLLNTERTLTILFWLLGGLGTSDWPRVGYLLPYILPSLAIVLIHGRVLNVFQLGEEQASQLGVNVERTRVLLLAAASLAAAAVVSLTGIIGFVGLIVPHMIRLSWGPDYRHLIPLSAVLGAAFLIACDLLARSVISPAELPIGVITSLFGGPFFLYLLRRHSRRIVM